MHIVIGLQGHPELDSLRSSYLQWLMTSGQEEKAGEVNAYHNCVIVIVMNVSLPLVINRSETSEFVFVFGLGR